MTKEKLEKELIRIAKEKVVSMEDREDLECHKSDEEDFFEIAIFELKNVMLAAYELGKTESKRQTTTSKPANLMPGWEREEIKVGGKTAVCLIKPHHEKSHYGINGGRILKLSIKVDGKTTVNYDRGWDVKPTDEISKAAYKQILKMYN